MDPNFNPFADANGGFSQTGSINIGLGQANGTLPLGAPFGESNECRLARENALASEQARLDAIRRASGGW